MSSYSDAFSSGDFTRFSGHEKKGKGGRKIQDAFGSGDFLSYLTYGPRERGSKNFKEQKTFAIDTNVFNYVGNHNKPRNVGEVSFTDYLHFGNEGIKKERRDDFLSYIPDVGNEYNGRESSPVRGIEGLAIGTERRVSQGISGARRHIGKTAIVDEGNGMGPQKRGISGIRKTIQNYKDAKQIRGARKLIKNEEEYAKRKAEKEKESEKAREMQELDARIRARIEANRRKEAAGETVTVKTNGTQESGETHAAKGYHGVIMHSKHFLVGEAGPERVDITPMRKRKDPFHIMNSGKRYFSGF